MKRWGIVILVTLLAASRGSAAETSSILHGLYGYYDFDAADPKDPSCFREVSGNSNPGAFQIWPDPEYMTGPPTYVPGVRGKAMHLGGGPTPGFGIVYYPLSSPQVLSCSIWAKMKEQTVESTMLAAASLRSALGQFQLSVIDGEITMRFGVVLPDNMLDGIETVHTGVKFPTGSWHHFVLVLDEPKVVLYLDGREIVRHTLAHSLREDSQGVLVLGARRLEYLKKKDQPWYQSPLGEWSGDLDEFAMWSRPLSAAEARGLYAAGDAQQPVFAAIPQYRWYETQAAMIAAAATAVVLLAAFLLRLHALRLKRRLARAEWLATEQRARNKIADDMHDELGARLAKLTIHSEHAVRDPLKAQAHLQAISETIQRANRSLDELVWTMRPANDSVPDLANYVADYASEFLQDTGIALRLDIANELPDEPLPPTVRHEIVLVCKEALSNILKHAQATEVGIRLVAVDRELEIAISDNGIGVPALSQRPTGRNGMRTMAERMERIGGTCAVEALSPRGTLVRLFLSLRLPR